MDNAQYLAELKKRDDLLAKQQIALRAVQEELRAMLQPPHAHGIFLEMCAADGDGVALARIFTGQQHIRVPVSTYIDADDLHRGDTVILNESKVIIGMGDPRDYGVLAVVTEVKLDRLVVTTEMDTHLVVGMADFLTCKAGDHVMIDTASHLAFEVMDISGTSKLRLEKVPDISYAEIGGLGPQVEQVRDALEMPYLYPDLFKLMKLRAPKGVLLHGPPGCGKTMVAKAVANSLAKQALGKDAAAWFLNINGPELLNKYVGETERAIRELFAEAREKATEGMPVIIFFDEMESMFRTRGAGISSDVESTIVPTILAAMDGVEDLANVIVIGASNREDLIDPGLLRPGRLDIKIKIDRPDQDGAHAIMELYLTDDLPLADNLKVMLDETVAAMFRRKPDTEFLEVTYVNGQQDTMYFCDFLSGAMIRSITDRAKRAAIKRFVSRTKKDDRITPMITLADLTGAVADEFRENEELPNTTNPDDWAKISGKKGERIASVRALRTKDAAGTIENVGNTGQYL
jgi:proteasome-associated ATPase